MTEHVASALFVYSAESETLIDSLQANAVGVPISPVALEELLRDPEVHLAAAEHVVVSGSLSDIRAILELAVQHDCSVGIVALPAQRNLVRTYALPVRTGPAIDLALRCEPRRISLIRCNGTLVLFKAAIGRFPLLASTQNISRWKIFVRAVKEFVGIRLLPFRFSTAGDQKVKTAACGCVVVPHQTGNRPFTNILRFSSVGDGLVTLFVSAPSSIVGYLRFLAQCFSSIARQPRRLPSTLAFIKSSVVDIESDAELKVSIDGETSSPLPAHLEALPDALALNVGEAFHEAHVDVERTDEKLNIAALPTGRDELVKAAKKNIPFFSYASDDRFHDLFVALREDARLNITFPTLMLLSTLLATIGLYQNSAAVVIGAMVLAPLMAPIISLAMGVVRYDRQMSRHSIVKILVGVAIALLAAASFTLLFPHKPITAEMQGRLHPSLLDLGVAIVAGIAGAYTRAYREMLQSIAGVAIAVALVPPLAVAGIGLGRLDLFFFGQAFLLFLTNLVGIILAGSVTFRVLGYSAAVRDKRSMGIVTVALLAIAVPLYLSYTQIVERTVLEKSWQQERFLVNGKYLIVQKAHLSHAKDKEIMTMDILAREVLTREDLTLFREKIQANFGKKLVVRANIIYIP